MMTKGARNTHVARPDFPLLLTLLMSVVVLLVLHMPQNAAACWTCHERIDVLRDLTAAEGQAINTIRFRINASASGWHIFDIAFTANDFTIENATLLARFKEKASIFFTDGDADPIEPGELELGRPEAAALRIAHGARQRRLGAHRAARGARQSIDAGDGCGVAAGL